MWIGQNTEIEWFIEDQAFSPSSYDRLLPPTQPIHSPLPSISSTSDTLGDWEENNLLTEKRGREWGEEPNHSTTRKPGSLYKSFNTLWKYRSPFTWAPFCRVKFLDSAVGGYLWKNPPQAIIHVREQKALSFYWHSVLPALPTLFEIIRPDGAKKSDVQK